MRRPSAATCAVALGCAALFGPLCVPLATGRIFTFDDLWWFHLPMRFIYQTALRSGQSILWTPDLANGLFLHAEGQVGMSHPLHLALYWLFPLSVAMNLEMLSSYVVAFTGMWLWLRRLSLAHEASLTGAMAFAFCGFNLLHLNHMNGVAIVAEIPWVLWGIDLVSTDASRRVVAAGAAAIAIVIGSQLLLGYPQYVWMSGLAVVWWAAFRLLVPLRMWRLVVVAAAALCGALIGAVQLLPTLDLAQSSIRVGTPLAFRLSLSLHPLNLLQLLSPYVFADRVYATNPIEFAPHELGVYDGALATVGILWLLMRWRALRQRRVMAALLTLCGGSLLLALGRFGGVYAFVSSLPGLTSFRAPARHIALFHLALSAVVALVIDDVVTIARTRQLVAWRRLWLLALPAALSVATAAAAHVLRGSAWAASHSIGFASDTGLVNGTAMVVLVALLAAGAARGWRGIAPLLIAATALDLAAWGIPYEWRGPPTRIADIRASVPVPEGAIRGEYISPRPNYVAAMNLYPMRGYRSTLAYVGLPPATILDPLEPLTKRLAGANWTWTGATWARVPDPMPRARLVTDVRRSSHVPADVQTIDIRTTALVTQRIREAVTGVPGTAIVVEDRNGRLVVQTAAPTPQLLVTTERFHSGWQADEDGQPLGVRPVYGDFLGCVVPPGTHTVTFRFAPASVRRGLWLSGIGVLLTAACLLAAARDAGPRSDDER